MTKSSSEVKAYCHIYAQWDQTGARIADEAKYLLGLGLVCDTTFGFKQGRANNAVLRAISAAGGLCAPNIYPSHFDPACRDDNWWKYSEAQCVDMLGAAGRRFAELDLGPMRAVNTYTPGNTFVAACRQTGVKFITGFCAPIVIEDGGWEIAHYGSPLSPYFVSDEDFRKPESGKRMDAVLMSSMELRNPLVCLNHWSEGPWCPLNAQAADRWLEPSADPLPFIQIAEDWLRQSEATGEPLFFHINLQYFFADRCFEHNRRALRWLAAQRDKGRLEVGGLQEWANRLNAADGFHRQVSYWRGEMMGFHVGHRPGSFPDVIVDESLSGQKIWQCPDPLPMRHYDYRPRWEYPAFQPDGNAPASSVTDDISVHVTEQTPGDTTRTFDIQINNDGEPSRIPLALWQAFDAWKGPFLVSSVSEGWDTKVVPHPSGSGGALLLEGELMTGVNHVQVSVMGGQPCREIYSKAWGQLVVGQTFYREGRPYTVLAAQTPELFVLSARIHRSEHDREPIVVEHLIGLEHMREPLVGDEVDLRFDGSRLVCWHRLWGVTADQIELIGVAETEARLSRMASALMKKSVSKWSGGEVRYQRFGNIRDSARWDRIWARQVGEAEMRRVNDWFYDQRPGAGAVVIEAHPGIFLPRGSITKVLGHEFDSVQCAPGYGFKELCVDYQQGWDWGVAGWVQWRHLKVRIDGLTRKTGTHLLHLHAFDPEHRDITQRVHFYNPEAGGSGPLNDLFPVHRKVDLCAVEAWTLPTGVEGRLHPSSLCSVAIPEACYAWPSVGVWIVPLEKMRLYDWISERGAPGLLSHLWLTCSE
ncbi:MAG: hypothetical protein WC205_03735 [Opitutaceae bacterium]|jgi:hypothetical protein